MKFKAIAALGTGITLLCSVASATIVTTGSGNWSSTVPDAPWPGGVVPTFADDVIIDTGFTVTNDVNSEVFSLVINVNGKCYNNNILTDDTELYGNGSLIQGTNATLTVANGTQANGFLAVLDASAHGNSVIYSGNAYFSKRQNYYNLTFSGGGSWYTGNVGIPNDPAVGPFTISGDLTVNGLAGPSIQLASAMTVNGDFYLGDFCFIDPSCNDFTVHGLTTVGGTLHDGCGINDHLADQFNSVHILPEGTWDLTDVTEWAVNGSLTNEGTILSTKGGITFAGTGNITGPSQVGMTIFTVTGNYEIDTPVDAVTNVYLSGALTMNVDNSTTPNAITLENNGVSYGGTLTVVNTGAPLVAGNSFQLFVSPAYGGTFTSITLPPLASGLTWVNDLYNTGTISVQTGSSVVTPNITAFHYNTASNILSLSFASTAGSSATYSVVYSTNLTTPGSFTHVLTSGIPSATSGATTTTTITPPAGVEFFRIRQP